MKKLPFAKPEKKVKTPKPIKRTGIKKTKNSFKIKKAKADKLFSLLIRKVRVCELQGQDHLHCNGVLQCAHIIGRSNHRLRWDPANALSLCQAHHLYYTYQAWSWQLLIKSLYPDRYEYLNETRNEVWDKDIDLVLVGLEGVA